MFSISVERLPELFAAFSSAQKLYIPADTGSGTAAFLPWYPGMALTKKPNTDRSAKDLFFPQTEDLYDVILDGKTVKIEDVRTECEDFILFGVRACDARSFSILDKVFLSDPVDTYYENRRRHGTVIALACSRPEETCFCAAFGIDPTSPAGDAAAWIEGGTLYLTAYTGRGEAALAAAGELLTPCGGEAVAAQQARVKAVYEKLPLAKVSFEGMKKDDLMTHFKSDKWASLSEACIGCGTCTFVCPTCQCYDVREFNTGSRIKKFRCWDSCMYSDFTLMAHGNSRNSQLERFRQRFMHKLVYFPENNGGEFGCVGCGRCLAKCPISMNIVKVEKALEGSAT